MKYLFIYAHLDDETILSYGTMLKLAQNNFNNIHVVILCGEGRNIQDNKKLELQEKRINAFLQNCQNFTYKLFPYKDLSLTTRIAKETIQQYISCNSPDIVFSHFANDLHYEHRLIAEEVLLACRRQRNSSVKALYATAAPSILQSFNLNNSFYPNYFIDITQFVDQKKDALTRYSMELPTDNNDIRSAESILAQNRQYGRLMNVKYCEAYQQIFNIE